MASVPAPPPVKGKLHLIMEGGQAGDSYDLKDETAVGRTIGDITFPHDGFMSGRHARVVRRGSSFVLVDEDSRNGTFIRINGEVELKPGDMIAYELQNGTVTLKRVEPFDTVFHEALSATLDEWNTPEDDEAFGDL